jgi:hypothetical protein
MSPDGTTSFETIRRSLAGTGFLIGAATLIAQLPLTVSLSMAAGRTAFGSTVFFFSFFTILCNILAVLCFLAVLLGDGGGLAFFRKPQVQSAVALYMLVVAIIYIAILEGLWAPTGLMRVLDTLLHYVMPAIFLIFWLIFVAKGTLAYADIPKILAFPFLYAVYVMIRGGLTGEYPYPIMDATELGYPTALLNTVFIFVLFLVLGLALVAYDRWAGKRSRAAHSG